MSIKNYEVCEHCQQNVNCEYDVDTDLYLCYDCWDKVKFTRLQRIEGHLLDNWGGYIRIALGLVLGAGLGFLLGHAVKIILS